MHMNSPQETAIDPAATAALAGAGLLAAAQGGPLLLAQGKPWRIIWANAKACSQLGTSDFKELTRMCLTGAEPGPRQLARLADTMSGAGEASVVRLRLRIGGAWQMLDLSCRRLAGPDAFFAIAPWGYIAPAIVESSVTPEPAAASDAGIAPAAPAGSSAKLQQAGNADPVMPGLAAHGTTPSILDRRGNVRFLWRTTRNGELSSITGTLCEVVGCDSSTFIGQDFRKALADLKLDPTGRLDEALSRQDTWSGIEVLWPITGTTQAVPVVLGALPGFDRARAFDGFSGFGVIHLDRITDALPQSADETSGLAEIAEPVVVAEQQADGLTPAEPEAFPALSGAVREQTSTATEETAAENAAPVRTVVDIEDDDLEMQEELHLKNRIKADAAETKIISAENVIEGRPNQAADASTETASPKAVSGQDAVADAEKEEQAIAAAPPVSDGNPAKPDAQPHSSNVVPIRAWQKDSRQTLAVTEAPNFARHRTDESKGEANGAGDPAAPTARAPETVSAPSTPSGIERRRGSDSAIITAPAATEGPASSDELVGLSPAERNAFREIARALGARTFEKSGPKNRDASAVEPAPAATARGIAGPIAQESSTSLTQTGTPVPGVPEQQTEDSNTLRLIERLDSGLLVSRNGVPAFVNKTMLDFLGYNSIDDFHKSGGLEHMFRGRDPDALSRDADGGAIPVIASNGDVIALEGRFQTIEWDNQPATLMTFRRTQGPELTARIRALELELRQSESEARETHTILETATDGVVLIDEEGRILNLNKSAQALFGYDQNEVAGEPFTILLTRDSHAAALDYLSGLKLNGVKSVLNDGRDITGRASQGGTIPLFMTLGSIGTSTPQRFCAVLRDLTQWKKVERDLSDAKREAERASALKSDFLAKISHEIRTPLNAILGFAEVIMDERFGPVGNERYKDYLKDIHSSGTHVLSLVNDLLDLSKIEAGKLDLNFGSVNANKIVNECVSLIQTLATRERVIIRLSLAPRLPNIVADERSLRQIVLNILSNAVKFNEPGGQVIVSTALTDAGHAVIRIRDTGIGMNEKELEMALEPFRQIATSRTTAGTGLGLPLTKALVEANRASFTINSRKGEGTLVEVSFPQTRVLAE